MGAASPPAASLRAPSAQEKKDPPPASDAASGSASGAGVSAGGVSAGSKKPRKKKEVPAAAVIEAAAPAPPAEAPAVKGAGRSKSERAAIVSRIMKEKGLNLIEASKYVKEHGIYKKGGALLTDKDAATMKPAGEKEPFRSGGTPNVTYSGKGKTVREPRRKCKISKYDIYKPTWTPYD